MKWEVANTPLIHDSASAGIFSIAFRDALNGVITGGDHQQPEKGGANLATTQDGGITWKLVDIAPQYYWSAVSYTPDHKNIMMVGPVNSTYMSHQESRQSWRGNLNALSFWSQNKALVVGLDGVIVEFDTGVNQESFARQNAK